MSGERLGLFGGSFDPVHRGHVEPVRQARETLRLDRVLYLPTARPPHKSDPSRAPEASPLARFAMVELALLDEEGLEVSTHELERRHDDAPAYTIDTLEHFAREHPDAELHLLLGADSLLHLPSWKRWRELPERARLVVMARPGWRLRRSDAFDADASAADDASGPDLHPELAAALEDGSIRVLRQVTVDVSSTEIRTRRASGEAVPDSWLHPRVLHYLDKYDLYR